MDKYRPENIKKFRAELGMTREQLVKEFKRNKVGITTRTILHWEAGKTKPNAADLEVMTRIFGKGIMLFFAPIHYQTGSVK